jgi:hypothetical protein
MMNIKGHGRYDSYYRALGEDSELLELTAGRTRTPGTGLDDEDGRTRTGKNY